MATMTDHLKKISLDAEAVVSATLALSRRGGEAGSTAVTAEPSRALTQRDQDLVRELAAAQAIIRDHESKVAEWKKKVEDAEEAQKMAGISFQKMRKDSEIFQIQYKKMEADIEVMKAEKVVAEQKAEDAEKGHGLREQVDSLKAELKVAKEQLKDVVPASQHDIVLGELKQVKEKLAEMENELTQANQKVSSLTAEKDDIDRKFGLVRETGKKLEEQNKKRKEQNQALLKERDSLQQELNVIKARPDSAVRVEGGQEDSPNEIESLKAQIAQLQTELKQEQSKQPGNAETSNSEIEKMKESFKQDEKRLQEEIQTLKQQLQDEKSNYNKAKNLAHTLTQKLKKLSTPTSKQDQEKTAEVMPEVRATETPAADAAKDAPQPAATASSTTPAAVPAEAVKVGTAKAVAGAAATPGAKPTPQGAQIAKILGIGNKQPGPGGQAGKAVQPGQAQPGQAKGNQMQGQKKPPAQHRAADQLLKQTPAVPHAASSSPGKVQLTKTPPAAAAVKTASPPKPAEAAPAAAASGVQKPPTASVHTPSITENVLRQKLLQAQQQKKAAAAANDGKQAAAPDAAEATAGKRLRSTVEVTLQSEWSELGVTWDGFDRNPNRKVETRATRMNKAESVRESVTWTAGVQLETLLGIRTRASGRDGSSR